jgi:aqualysin 1
LEIKMMKISNLLRALVVTGFSTVVTLSAMAATGTNNANTLIPNQYIVMLKPNYCSQLANRPSSAQRASHDAVERTQDVSTPDCNIVTAAQALMGRHGGRVEALYKGMDGFVAYVPDGNAAALRADASVQFADQDRLMQPLFNSGVRRPRSWGLDRLDVRQAPEDLSDLKFKFSGTGKGVTIFSIDDGVRRTTTELSGRIAQGAVVEQREILWNFGITALTLDGFADGDWDPCDGHGTELMTLAAGQSFGVANEATIVPVKVSKCAPPSKNTSTTLSRVVAGIYWAMNQQIRPAVIHIPLGLDENTTPNDGRFSATVETLRHAAKKAVEAGFAVVTAAGSKRFSSTNSCSSAFGLLPLVTPLIHVGATNRKDRRWETENAEDSTPITDSGSECVTLYAPGVNLGVPQVGTVNNIVQRSGTSVSSALVAGIAAILLERSPNATPAQIKQQLISASVKDIVGGLEGDLRPNNRLATATNLWPLSVAIASMTATIDTSWYSPSWRPYVTITLKHTRGSLPWNGAITLRGNWDTGDAFSCVINAFTHTNANQLTDANCVHKGPLMAKSKRRSARIDITSIEGTNVTYDQGQNVIASLFVRQN